MLTPELITNDKLPNEKSRGPLLRDLFVKSVLTSPYELPHIEDLESKEEEFLCKDSWFNMSSKSKIKTKRKSESWNSKPLESGNPKEPEPENSLLFPAFDHSYDGVLGNIPQIDMISSTAKSDPSTLDLRLNSIIQDNDLSAIHREIFNFEPAPFHYESVPVDMKDEHQIAIPSRVAPIVKSRRSEDWSAKPKLKRAKSLPVEEKSPDTQKRRVKWSREELEMLWKGILKEGNNWKEISKILKSRSYFQIKDKGRRLLFMRGWTTGRNKNDTDEGNMKAKAIAKIALAEMK